MKNFLLYIFSLFPSTLPFFSSTQSTPPLDSSSTSSTNSDLDWSSNVISRRHSTGSITASDWDDWDHYFSTSIRRPQPPARRFSHYEPTVQDTERFEKAGNQDFYLATLTKVLEFFRPKVEAIIAGDCDVDDLLRDRDHRIHTSPQERRRILIKEILLRGHIEDEDGVASLEILDV